MASKYQNVNMGQSRLQALDLSPSVIARRVGVSRMAPIRWLRGETSPEPDLRLKIRDIWGIAPSDWEESTLTREEQTASRDPSKLLTELIGQLQAARSQASPAALVRLATTSARLIEARERLLTDRQKLLESTEWSRLMGRMLDALQAHPTAMLDLIGVLQEEALSSSLRDVMEDIAEATRVRETELDAIREAERLWNGK